MTTATMEKKKANELTATEAKRLAECEGIIEGGRQTFMEVGRAMAEIRNSRLYRKEHKTFQAYCEAKWGWGASRARQIIGAADVAKAKSVTNVTLLNEAAGRALRSVPKEKRQKVLESAARRSTKKDAKGKPEVSAKDIEEAASESPKAPERPSKEPAKEATKAVPPRPPKQKDEAGRDIPDKAAEALARTEEFKALEREVHEVKRKVLKLASEPIGHNIRAQQMESLFKEICAAIEWARPWTSCPINELCKASCKCCKGTHFVNADVWKNIPKEFKK